MITFWLTLFGMFFSMIGSGLLAVDAFKKPKDLVKKSDFGKVPVLSKSPTTKEGAEELVRQILTPSILRDLKKAKWGLALLVFGFLLQFIGMFFNIPEI